MVCVPWNGLNNKGQAVSPDSFYTKTAGCDSAEDRVMVENNQRPKYMSYVTLGAQGIDGDFYGNEDAVANTASRYAFDKSRDQLSGNFGTQWGANVANTSCSIGAYERNMAQLAQDERAQTFLQNGQIANNNRMAAGNRY
jgi:hypothetical protein